MTEEIIYTRPRGWIQQVFVRPIMEIIDETPRCEDEDDDWCWCEHHPDESCEDPRAFRWVPNLQENGDGETDE
jgi:hypothetical protein